MKPTRPTRPDAVEGALMQTRGDIWLRQSGNRWHFAFTDGTVEVTQYADGDDNRPGDRIQVRTACSRQWAFEHINTLLSAGYVFV